MDLKNSAGTQEKNQHDLEEEDTQERQVIRKSSSTGILEKGNISSDEHGSSQGDHQVNQGDHQVNQGNHPSAETTANSQGDRQGRPVLSNADTHQDLSDAPPGSPRRPGHTILDVLKRSRESQRETASTKAPPFRRRQALKSEVTWVESEAREDESEVSEVIDTRQLSTTPTAVEDIDTQRLSAMPDIAATPRPETALHREAPPRLQAAAQLPETTAPVVVPHVMTATRPLSRPQALLGIALLLILIFSALNAGYAQFLGPQGWAFVLGGPASSDNGNLVAILKGHHLTTPTPGVTTTVTPLTPQAYINELVQNMTLNQKLGQMMIVQFLGPTYSLDISSMISQYNIGAVLLFTANNNIQSKDQLKGLIQQMKSSSVIPLAIAIDQEGGYVDRLVSLDGARPSAASIGATGDPAKARAEGVRDAQDLASYGFNLNLAPVVDVTNVYNAQMYGRTFGTTPDAVIKMTAAYLQGLQQSGQVLGTLKHFPGLGDVAVDPHIGVPDLYRSRNLLESIDWAPYRSLISQGLAHVVMVTHELVHAVDNTTPSSLSYKVVTGILRDELGFNGVVMTDSLTMEGIRAFYTVQQAAALAVEAGDDLLMGASTPQDVASMIDGIKQAISSGAISMQRIDQSVQRILMMKYQMGLLPLPTN